MRLSLGVFLIEPARRMFDSERVIQSCQVFVYVYATCVLVYIRIIASKYFLPFSGATVL